MLTELWLKPRFIGSFLFENALNCPHQLLLCISDWQIEQRFDLKIDLNGFRDSIWRSPFDLSLRDFRFNSIH